MDLNDKRQEERLRAMAEADQTGAATGTSLSGLASRIMRSDTITPWDLFAAAYVSGCGYEYRNTSDLVCDASEFADALMKERGKRNG